jgi:hypothetical protein
VNTSAIACIGWGSLVWEPRTLPCAEEWRNDGPLLPVEFARESGDQPETRRITLLICESAQPVPTCWTQLRVDTIGDARKALAVREYEKASRQWTDKYIGFCELETGAQSGREAETIAAWAARGGLRGAVWTDLPCGFRDKRGTMLSADEVIAYLSGLDGPACDGAEKYVRRAPAQVATQYRQQIVEALGWSYRD